MIYQIIFDLIQFGKARKILFFVITFVWFKDFLVLLPVLFNVTKSIAADKVKKIYSIICENLLGNVLV